MTVFEILNFNRELLNRLSAIGFRPDDCKYIELYAEYDNMRRRGEKVTYAVSERKIYEIIKRFGKDCTPCAV